jgi:hypothetical protein
VRDDGVSLNARAISAFRLAGGRWWRWVLDRRSPRTAVSMARGTRHLARWVPPACVCHLSPLARLASSPTGGIRMRACRTSGSVERVRGTHHSYSVRTTVGASDE